MKKKYYKLIPALIIVAGFIVRYFYTSYKQISLDESSVIDRVSRGFIDTVIYPKHSEQILPETLWVLTRVFGHTELTIRIVPIIITAVSFAFLFIIYKHIFDRATATLSILLISLSFLSIISSFDPKGYILGTLFMLISTERALRRKLQISAMLLTLSIICHFSLILYSPIPFLCYILLLPHSRKTIIKALLVYLLSSLVGFCIIVIPYLLLYRGKMKVLIPDISYKPYLILQDSFIAYIGGNSPQIAVYLSVILFIVGFFFCNWRKKIIFLYWAIASLLLVFFVELKTPFIKYFLLKHTLLSFYSFLGVLSYGIVKIISQFSKKIISFTLTAVLLLPLLSTNYKSFKVYNTMNFTLSSPIDMKGLLDKIKYNVSDNQYIYFDPYFTTKGLGILLITLYVKKNSLNPNIIIDKNTARVMEYTKVSPLFDELKIKYIEDVSFSDKLNIWIVLPLIISTYYDELNIIEWWKADYRDKFFKSVDEIRKEFENMNFDDIYFSLGLVALHKTIPKDNLLTFTRILTAKYVKALHLVSKLSQ